MIFFSLYLSGLIFEAKIFNESVKKDFIFFICQFQRLKAISFVISIH